MRNFTFFIFLLLLIISWSGFSQSVLSGSVKNENGESLSGATIVISKDSTAAILAYGISDTNGHFGIKINTPSDSLFLKISYIGYKTWTKKIRNKNQQFQVQLSISSEELKEVHIESKIIEQRGDTLSFSVSAFKDKKDRVIADVIRKMPGIDIMPSGQIHYQGLPIQKYYIEGLDLLEGRYSLANNNISADDVSKVQILENHQSIKVLDSLQFSERASLNIRLKKDVTVSGTAELGVGFSPLLRRVKITPMLFTKKQQAIVTYQSNNTGSDVSREIRDFSFENLSSGFSINKTDWLSIQKLSEPPFLQERWLNNNVHLGSINFLQRLKKDVDLKVNISYLNDSQKQHGSTQTRYFTLTDTIDVLEDAKNAVFINTLQSKFTLEKNTKKNYLKNQLEINGYWNSERGFIYRPNAEISQRLNNPFTAIQNKFQMLETVGKQLVIFRSNTGYTRANQNLTVAPGQFSDILNNGEAYAEINQFLESANFFTDNSAGFTKALGNFTLSSKIGFAIENKQLDSEIVLSGEARNLGADYKNRLNFFSSQAYLENSIRFQNRDKTWNLRLSTPLSLKDYILQDENFSEERKLNRLVFEPTLYVKNELTPFWETSLSAGVNYNFGDIQQLYTGFLLTNYRNLQRYNAPISEQISQRYSGSLSYRNPLNQLFLSGSYSYVGGRNNLLYSNRIGANGSQVLEAIEQENFSKAHSFSLGGSKYFTKINTSLKLSADFRLDQRDQLLNGNLTDVRNNSLFLNSNLNSEIFSWLSADYDVKISFYETAFGNTKFQQIKTTQHILGLFFYPKANQFLSAGGEYYQNSLSTDNGNYFMNLSYQYTFEAPKMDLNISWNNVLNTDEFINAYNSGFSYAQTTYSLRPSQVLVSLKFSF